MDKMREAFEAWAGAADFDLGHALVPDGMATRYRSAETRRLWAAWKAATMAERSRCYAIVADDASAISYQTLGQYRTGMLKAIRGQQ